MEFIARYSFLFKSPQRGVQGCENQIEQGGSIMASYQTKDIRNIALMGHGSEGKTTLMEALLFAAGAIDRQGRVEDGNTVTDYDAEEIKRKISISAAIAPIDWNQKMLNVIDVPGYFDFVGEMMGPLRVVETAAILVSAVSGIAVGTEKAWDYATKNNVGKCSSSTRWTVTMPTL